MNADLLTQWGASPERNFYCISVRTGMEEKYMESARSIIEESEGLLDGTLHLLRKRMRLKSGKEYYDLFFPGYMFFETEETDPAKLRILSSGAGFLHYLPSNQLISPLTERDLSIVTSILRFGSTIGIVPVTFDAGDKIVILGGPFKDLPGKVIAVNRRNKRVNIQLDFMNGMRVVGLSYEEVQKQ